MFWVCGRGVHVRRRPDCNPRDLFADVCEAGCRVSAIKQTGYKKIHNVCDGKGAGGGEPAGGQCRDPARGAPERVRQPALGVWDPVLCVAPCDHKGTG